MLSSAFPENELNIEASKEKLAEAFASLDVNHDGVMLVYTTNIMIIFYIAF